jgi:hypothetical protein
MDYDTSEISRQYRLNFDRGEGLWADHIPPEITSDVTGIRTKRTIDRTSLLTLSLLNISHVETADLAFDGWMKLLIKANADFDEVAFKQEVADVVNGVKQLRSENERTADLEWAEPASRVAPSPSATPNREMQAA